MNAPNPLRTLCALCARSAAGARPFIAMFAFTACTWGVKASDIPWSQGPHGAPARVELMGSTTMVAGELLAVDTAGVLLYSTAIGHVPWTTIRSLAVDKLGGDYRVTSQARPSLETIQRLARVSRFPQGVEPALLTKLLASVNQKALEELR